MTDVTSKRCKLRLSGIGYTKEPNPPGNAIVQFGIDPQSCGGHGEPSAISIIIDELSDAMPLCAGTINIDTSNNKRPKVRMIAIL